MGNWRMDTGPVTGVKGGGQWYNGWYNVVTHAGQATGAAADCKRFTHPAGPNHQTAQYRGDLTSYMLSRLHVTRFGLHVTRYM